MTFGEGLLQLARLVGFDLDRVDPAGGTDRVRQVGDEVAVTGAYVGDPVARPDLEQLDDLFGMLPARAPTVELAELDLRDARAAQGGCEGEKEGGSQ